MADDRFSVSMNSAGGALEIRLRGDLDVLGALVLASGTTDVPAPTTREVRVDGRDVTFLDSSGIRGLIELRDRATKGGAWFSLERLPEAHRAAIELAGLLEYLQVGDDGVT